MQFLQSWLRYLGVALVTIIAFFCMFAALNERDFLSLPRESLKRRLAAIPILMEHQFYDRRSAFQYRVPKVEPDITMLVIDELSLKKVGRFPWTRTVWAHIIDKLAIYGAQVVAFDVMFSEPETICNGPSPDKALADAIRRFQATANRHVILPFMLTEDPELAFKEMPTELYLSTLDGVGKGSSSAILSYIAQTTFPIPELLAAGPSLGSITILPSDDGVFRRAALVSSFNSTPLPSLPLAAFRYFFTATAGNSVKYYLDESLDTYQLLIQRNDEKEPWRLDLDRSGEAKLHFTGGTQNFRTISIKNFLEASETDKNMSENFRNKVVFIGSIAEGAHDLRNTPVDHILPGVYFHANAFTMLKNRLAYRPVHESFAISLALLLVNITLLVACMVSCSPLLHAIGLVTLSLATFFIDRLHFLPQGYTLSILFILIAIGTSYSWMTLFDFIATVLERRKIRSAFTRYVAPDIVKEMLAHPELLKVGGQKRNVSIIFSDIRDFTSISEKLSPQDLATLLNRYMGRMTDILFESKGTLDKYIGDAIVGFWGAPIEIPEHPYHAVTGSLQMVEELKSVNAQFREMKFPEISIGIGINTGDVSIGNMGSDRIFAYTALGDNMNLASRLEGLTKVYGVNLLISEFTYAGLGNRRSEFHIRPIDLVRVKGKEKAVKIYEALHPSHPLLQNMSVIERYTRGFELYQQRQFQEALEIFKALCAEFPKDKASAIHRQNCEHYIAKPPEANWDGATTFTTK